MSFTKKKKKLHTNWGYGYFPCQYHIAQGVHKVLVQN